MSDLNKLTFSFRRSQVVVCIIDGVGIGKEGEGNAFYRAKTPVLDDLKKNAHYSEIGAHGKYVGLSSNDIGNSEVGHNTLGCGRVTPKGNAMVDCFFENNFLVNNKTWNKLIDNVLEHGSTFHFLGLLSDGGVHSHIDHLKHLILSALEKKVFKIRIHILLDGRDVSPQSAHHYIKDLEYFLEKHNEKYDGDIKIASCGGREVITMDRYEADWKKVEYGWKVHVQGDAPIFKTVMEGLETVRKSKKIDQFLDPFVIGDERPIGQIKDHDSVLNFNYRGDRSIEISQVFDQKEMKKIQKKYHPDVFYAGLVNYDLDKGIPRNYIIEPDRVDDPMGFYQIQLGKKIFAISETQKFGHVTYFWNGNKSGKINEELEDYFEIPSDLSDFDKNPPMKSREITDKTVELIKSKKYASGRLNFPNGDMIGHTGNLKAAIESVETVDECIGRLKEAIDEVGGVLLILGDHGNCEDMLDEDGGIKTSHTKNKVPLYIYDSLYNGEYELLKGQKYGLSNIASTVFNLMGYEKPNHYDPSMIEFFK